MRGGCPKAEVVVTAEKREACAGGHAGRRRPKRTPCGRRSSCGAPKGRLNSAQHLHITPQTISKWRARFVTRWLDEPLPINS